MAYSSANVAQIPIDQYVSIVYEIYSPQDINRSIWDVWCHTLHHAGAVAEKIRTGGTASDLASDPDIADLALWLFTALHKLRGKIGERKSSRETPEEPVIRISRDCSEMLWHKYHDVLAERQESIDDWQRALGDAVLQMAPNIALKDIAFRLLEGLCEASDALIRMYCYTETGFISGEPNRRQANLEEQLAEVLAWLFALVRRLEIDGPPGKVSLSSIIWQRYGNDDLSCFCCRHCKKPVCSCAIILVPATHSVDKLLILLREK